MLTLIAFKLLLCLLSPNFCFGLLFYFITKINANIKVEFADYYAITKRTTNKFIA